MALSIHSRHLPLVKNNGVITSCYHTFTNARWRVTLVVASFTTPGYYHTNAATSYATFSIWRAPYGLLIVIRIREDAMKVFTRYNISGLVAARHKVVNIMASSAPPGRRRSYAGGCYHITVNADIVRYCYVYAADTAKKCLVKNTWFDATAVGGNNRIMMIVATDYYATSGVIITISYHQYYNTCCRVTILIRRYLICQALAMRLRLILRLMTRLLVEYVIYDIGAR